MTRAPAFSLRRMIIFSAGLLALANSPAHATFHLWAFNELFSNADGTVQFIELFTTSVSQQFAFGETFRATQDAQVHDYVFPGNTPAPTNNHHLLIATAGFAALPGAPVPDFIIPDGFLFTPNGALQNMAILGPTIVYANLPIDGITSLAGDGVTTGVNSPTNYAGDTGQIDVSETGAVPPFLLWAQTLDDAISTADLDGMLPAPVVSFPQSNGVVDVAVDPVGAKMYWGQVFEDRIQRANLDGTAVQTLVAFPDAEGITAVAIDPVGRKLYWAQTFDDRILRADLTGANVEVLLQFPQVADVVALEIDSAGSKLYWAEAFDDKIRRADLDGSAIEELVAFPDVSGVVDIALDRAADSLYWAQSFGSRIRRADLSGAAIMTVLETPATNDLVALAVEPSIGKLYWVQRVDDQVRRADVSGANVETVLDWPTVEDPVALTVGSVQAGVAIGACCNQDDTCTDDLPEIDCTVVGGTFQGVGSTCVSVTCATSPGACCLPDDSCLELFEADCLAIAGASWAGALTTCPGACVVPPAPAPCENVPGVRGNRYVSARCPGTGGSEVLRVTLVALDGFPLPAPDFLYVGAPFQAPEEDLSQPGLTFTAAPLQCGPHIHDWASEGAFWVYGAEIVPGSEYQLQRADAACGNLANEACWSTPITLVTGKFGDVWPLFDDPANPPQPDFSDIAATVRKFVATPDAPIKAVAQLQPNVVFPNRPIDFKDVAANVAAFVGTSTYAETNNGPCTCPSVVACGVTACANDLACSGGLCVGGFCADACGRCVQ